MSASRSRPALAVVLAGITTTAGVAVAAHGPAHGAPVIRAAPRHPPATSRAHGVCVVPGRNSTDRGRADELVWVKRHPSSVVTIWLPGLNSRRCAARRVVGGHRAATRIATAIEHGRRVRGSAYACPSDDATRVAVYLRYSGAGDEHAGIALAGCRWISAPHRSNRWVSASLSRALKPLAPRAWRSYLH